MEHLPDGSLLCTALVNSLKEISWWLLSYGSAVEVLAPPALRLTFTQIAQEMATLYDVSSPPQLYMDTILVAEDTPAPYQPDSQPNGNP
jgi:hypothetical protein